MNRTFYVQYLKDFPEYKWVVIIHLKTTEVCDLYRTKKEATHAKREYYPNGTVMHRDKFIEKYRGA